MKVKTVKMYNALEQRAEEFCRRNNVTFSELVRVALEYYMNHVEKIAQRRKRIVLA